MPERTYMQVDARRDHSFRVPRPDLAPRPARPTPAPTATPTATPPGPPPRSPGASPTSRHRGPHFATAFAAARRDPSAQADALIALARRPELAGIVRASALDLLAPVADATIADRSAPLLADPDPLVRAAAATLQRGLAAGPRLDRLLPVLRDPARSVRIAAAKAMLGANPTRRLGGRRARASPRPPREWRSALVARADFPETHMQIGGAALGARNVEVADSAFREAVALDPQLVDAWAMIARIHAATGDLAGARRALGEGLAANPRAPLLEALLAELGP